MTETATPTFVETPIPATVGRSAGPNPFDGLFPTKPEKSLSLNLSGNKEANKAEIKRYTNAARGLAERLDPPMSARVQVTENTSGKTVTTTITVWTVARIVRPRKVSATETPEAVAANEASGDNV